MRREAEKGGRRGGGRREGENVLHPSSVTQGRRAREQIII
jgi:hypothetical protein